jgi:MoxR-like ATPase
MENKVFDEFRSVYEVAERFIDNVQKVIVGKRATVELLFNALLCGGHVLVEDVPGLGKTLLAKAAARSLDCSFKRIQCTPDLLPSDVTGISFFNQKTCEFEFRPGPLFAQIVLVDEINRAMPRTQSCLLESMEERQVTVDLETIPLPRPFMIIATQNPIETGGTFPLPEAQLDRFLFKLRLGYPAEGEEAEILERFRAGNPLEPLGCVVGHGEILELQAVCRRVFVEDSLRRYMLAVIRNTRSHPDIRLGSSPRASVALQTACQVHAAIRGRGHILPDDVKFLAVPVLSHRLISRTEARLKGRSEEDLVREILETTPVPVESDT